MYVSVTSTVKGLETCKPRIVRVWADRTLVRELVVLHAVLQHSLWTSVIQMYPCHTHMIICFQLQKTYMWKITSYTSSLDPDCTVHSVLPPSIHSSNTHSIHLIICTHCRSLKYYFTQRRVQLPVGSVRPVSPSAGQWISLWLTGWLTPGQMDCEATVDWLILLRTTVHRAVKATLNTFYKTPWVTLWKTSTKLMLMIWVLFLPSFSLISPIK